MSNPIRNTHLDHNDEPLHQETADLLGAFQMLCRKCRSGDVQIVNRGFATSTITLVCLGCGASAALYNASAEWGEE